MTTNNLTTGVFLSCTPTAATQTVFSTVYVTTLPAACETSSWMATYTVSETCTGNPAEWTPPPVPAGFVVATVSCGSCNPSELVITCPGAQPTGVPPTVNIQGNGVTATITATPSPAPGMSNGSGSGAQAPANTAVAPGAGSGWGAAPGSGSSAAPGSGSGSGSSPNMGGMNTASAPGSGSSPNMGGMGTGSGSGSGSGSSPNMGGMDTASAPGSGASPAPGTGSGLGVNTNSNSNGTSGYNPAVVTAGAASFRSIMVLSLAAIAAVPIMLL